jgi:hypothetical protein
MSYKEICSLCKGNGYITVVVKEKDEIKQCWLCESKGEKEYSMKENNLKNNLFESVIDVGSGYLLAVAIQLLIFPLFGLYPTILDSMGIALIFTVISMMRSWTWRCYFRRKHIIRSH